MKLIMESWRQYVQEAIIDAPSERLSDIFDDNGVMRQEVTNIIRDAVSKLRQWLSQTYPGLDVTEVFVVGAAVTYQFAPTSDVDISVVIPGMNAEQADAIDDWMADNLVYPDWSVEGSSRPFQFKPMENNKNYAHVDSAYNPFENSWIKEPDLQHAQAEFERYVTDPESKENKMYQAVERAIQPSLQRLYQALESEVVNEAASEALKDLLLKAYKRYEKIKTMRKKAYSADPGETGRISQNWWTGNIIYKFLDREGYTDVYGDIKKAVKSKFANLDQSFLDGLKQKLARVVSDEIGFVREEQTNER